MSNQGCTEILVGFGKGCSTDTILTDQGKDITVLRNQPYRTNVAKKLECGIPLGARPMHKSTLILEEPSAVVDYASSYNQCFTNQKIQPIIKHSGYPDEIKHLGMNIEGKGHPTTHKEAFWLKEFILRSILNKALTENQTKDAQGLTMREITNPTGSSQHYSTSYSSTHDIRRVDLSCANISEFHPKRHTHNIITGEQPGAVIMDSFDLVSYPHEICQGWTNYLSISYSQQKGSNLFMNYEMPAKRWLSPSFSGLDEPQQNFRTRLCYALQMPTRNYVLMFSHLDKCQISERQQKDWLLFDGMKHFANNTVFIVVQSHLHMSGEVKNCPMFI